MLKSTWKKLIDFLGLSLSFKSKSEQISLPDAIDDEELISRSIFSPVNVTKKYKLRTNVYKSPPEMDEVSVNRLNYTTPTFCKVLSKKIEQPENKRKYFGLAILKASEIRETKSDVVYSPIISPKENKNPFHADIKVGYIKPKGEQLYPSDEPHLPHVSEVL